MGDASGRNQKTGLAVARGTREALGKGGLRENKRAGRDVAGTFWYPSESVPTRFLFSVVS